MSRHVVHIDKSRRHTDFREEAYQIVRNHLPVSKGDKILDIGCGLGEFLEEITIENVYKVGIDTDNKCIEICRQHVDDPTFQVADACNLPFGDGFFDVVVALGIIEHVDNPIILLREAFRVLRGGGHAAFMTPNIGRPQRLIFAMQKRERWEFSGHNQGWDYHLFKHFLEHNEWKVDTIVTRFVDFPLYRYFPKRFGRFMSYRLLPRLFPWIGSELYAFCRKS